MDNLEERDKIVKEEAFHMSPTICEYEKKSKQLEKRMSMLILA